MDDVVAVVGLRTGVAEDLEVATDWMPGKPGRTAGRDE